MVKRRNSPYASHDRSLPTRVPIDRTPTMVGPMLMTNVKRKAVNDEHWSPGNPDGRFFI